MNAVDVALKVFIFLIHRWVEVVFVDILVDLKCFRYTCSVLLFHAYALYLSGNEQNMFVTDLGIMLTYK